VHATLTLAAAHNPDYEQAPAQPPKFGPLILTDENGKSFEVSRESILETTRELQKPWQAESPEGEGP
jgi:hypothetical protein